MNRQTKQTTALTCYCCCYDYQHYYKHNGSNMSNDIGNSAEYFDEDEVREIVKASCDSTLKDKVYNSKKVHEWASSIVEGCLKQLQTLSKPYKYVVTSVIMQKNGAGLHTAHTCYWDTRSDGSSSVRCEYETMHAIVTVFALHI